MFVKYSNTIHPFYLRSRLWYNKTRLLAQTYDNDSTLKCIFIDFMFYRSDAAFSSYKADGSQKKMLESSECFPQNNGFHPISNLSSVLYLDFRYEHAARYCWNIPINNNWFTTSAMNAVPVRPAAGISPLIILVYCFVCFFPVPLGLLLEYPHY